MAKRIRAGKTTPEFKSKSDRMRSLFRAGKSVGQVASEVGVGYAFAYGVAKRAGLADTAASRRKTRAVAIGEGGLVTIQTAIGPVTVSPDGTVTRPRAKRAAKVPAGE